MKRKIIIDTDPGIDDAMAILFALNSPDLDLLGLTTVYGNVHTPLATANALALLDYCGRSDVPVAAGAGMPLEVPLHGVASFVHGDNGLGEVELPRSAHEPEAVSAAEFIVGQVLFAPGEVTLVAVGPLTNLALALERDPRIAEAAEVVLMGGAVDCAGNITACAEANIYHDPHAAAKVFSAGWPVTMIGLDVTARTVMDEEYLESLRATRSGELIHRLTRFYTRFYRSRHGIDGAQTHDPSAVAALIDADLFGFRRGRVEVVLEGEERGRTLLVEGEGPVAAATEVDSRLLLELFRARILHAVSSEAGDGGVR